jgi:UDP-3-O-[3-hydroxymyristoyl] glucosamine N-acyltransferase
MLRAKLHEQEIRRVIGAPGAGDRSVDGVAPIDSNENRCLYFLNHNPTPETRQSLARRDDCIIIVPAGSDLEKELGNSLVLETRDPRSAIAQVLGFIRDEARDSPWVTTRQIAGSAKVSPLAVVEGNVEIGDEVVIEPFCVIGPDVRVGRESILRSGVRVYPRVEIGEYSTVGSNTVIGHEGYSFVRDKAGNKTRMPHLGGVLIRSHVEIGALTTVLSGTITPTLIEDHAKIDDHVHVAHNARIASGASVIAAVVIGGHAAIEREAWIGMNASIREGLRVGSYALVGMDVSLQQDLPDRTVARAPRPDVRPRADDDPATIGFKRS